MNNIEFAIKKHNKFCHFIVICCILLSRSVYYESLGQTLLNVPFFLFCLYYAIQKHIRIDANCFWLLFCTVVLIICSVDFVVTTSFLFCLRMLTAILVVELVTFEVFSRIFVKFITFIGVASLLSIPLIFFNIHSPLPSFIASDGRAMQNFIFFQVTNSFYNSQQLRSSGLWWEPGAFAVFLNTAYLFNINNKLSSIKNNLLFFLLIISTQSTTGIIAFALLFISNIRKFNLNSKKNLLLIFAIVLLIILMSFTILPSVFKKFDSDDGNFVSFLSRFNDVYLSYQLFKEHWLFGYGFAALEDVLFPACSEYLGEVMCVTRAKPTGADGVTMIFSQLGIFSIYILKPFLFPKYIYSRNKIRLGLIALAILITFNTENFSFLMIFNIMSFYGIKNYCYDERSNA